MMIDGLVLPDLNDRAITDMFDGGLDAAVYPAAIWQDTPDAIAEFARVRRIVESSSRGVLIRTVNDIDNARKSGKTGIILGWQNSDGFGGNLDLVPLYQELGLRCLSIAFNYANAAGGGCYEPVDGGLTAYGHDLVASCNALGILLDLTHVGDRTGGDILRCSTKPVCYSHASPRAMQGNRRNKTDDQMRAVAQNGGIVGIAALPHFLPRELESTIDDYVAVVRHVLDVAGEDHVGFGTDMTPGQSMRFLQYTAARKGIGTPAVDYAEPPRLPGLSEFSDYPGVLAKLADTLGPRRLDKFSGANWKRVFQEAWSQ